MKKLYTCVVLLFLGYVSGQKIAWQREVKSSTQDFLTQLISTIDGQILVAGSTINLDNQQISTTGSKNSGYDYHVIKVDQQGEKFWDKFYSGNLHDYLNVSLAAQDGSFLLAGTSYSTKALDKKETSFGGSDMWIIKLDENGEEQWQRTIGTRQNEEARAAVQTIDLGYIVAGSTNHSQLSFGQKDVFLVKLDKAGKITKQIILGGSGLDEVESIVPTKDGGCLVGVYSRSTRYENNNRKSLSNQEFLQLNPVKTTESISGRNTNTHSNTNNNANVVNNSVSQKENFDITFYAKQSEAFGDGDYWVVKLDKDANVEWDKTFGGSSDDHIKVLALTDSGFIIGGESRSQTSGNKKASNKEGTDLWLIALDENGNEQWQKSCTFGNRDVLMSLNAINNRENKTKGFLIGGYTQAEEKIKKNDETFWMLYVDNKGEEVWRKHVEAEAKKNQERLTNAILTKDGAYILAGTSAEQLGEENWKILKLKDPQVEDLLENKNLQIYPNPVKDYCYVEIGVDFTEADLLIYDMTGRLIQQSETRNKVTKLNTANLPQGLYIVKAQTNNQQNQLLTTKIIKE